METQVAIEAHLDGDTFKIPIGMRPVNLKRYPERLLVWVLDHTFAKEYDATEFVTYQLSDLLYRPIITKLNGEEEHHDFYWFYDPFSKPLVMKARS